MRRLTVIALLLIVFSSLIPLGQCEINGDTTTLYLRSDVYETFSNEGYGVDSSNTAEAVTVTGGVNATDDMQCGFRVYLLTNNTSTELSSGTPTAILQRGSNGAGVQNATFTVATHRLTIGQYALKFVLYIKDVDNWVSKAVFVSSELITTGIEGATWTFSVYTNLTDSVSSVSWGDDTYISCIDGVVFEEADFMDTAFYYFWAGDYIMFFLYPYTRLIGMGPFASIILFGIGLTVYVRFRNFYFLLLILVMLSLGGVLNLIMGDALWGFVALIATFGLAALYWRVFR